jgi:hypothetical protein
MSSELYHFLVVVSVVAIAVMLLIAMLSDNVTF